MHTPGSMGVNQQGAATYSVPLSLPPGIAGVEPKLSLEYDSLASNGLLGVGWNLAGLSVITRCGATQASDGRRAGVTFTNYDNFCLDGQRLNIYLGSYGYAGSTYRTERDSFSLVTSNGRQGNGPASFTVKTKDGLTLQYGASADSAIKATGNETVRVWAINRITDTVGNYMTVSYTVDGVNGSYYPSSISYTGNGAQAPTNQVRFAYTPRADQVPLYVAGSVVRNTQLLSSIQTYAANNLVKTYSLSYQTQTHGSRLPVLTAIQEAQVDQGERLPALQVGWPTAQNFAANCIANGTVNCSQAFAAAPQVGLSDAAQSYAGWKVQVADLNTDGRNDLLGYNVTGSNLQLQTWLGTDSATMTRLGNPINIGLGTTPSSAATVLMGDINADGNTDIVALACDSGTLVATSVKGNGDGSFAAPTVQSFAGFSCSTAAAFRLVDLNGLGAADIVWVNPSSAGVALYALLNTSQGFGAPTALNQPAGVSAPPAGFSASQMQQFNATDFNGDGIQDMVVIYSNANALAVQYWPGQSNGYVGAPVTAFSYNAAPGIAGYGYAANYSLQLMDLNNDGFPDLVAVGTGNSGVGADVWLNQGNGQFTAVRQNALFAPSASVPALSASWTPVFGDVNGDGMVDVVYGNANAAAGSTAAYVFMGNGDGGFTQAWGVQSLTGSSTAGSSGWSLLMSDLRGLGRADLLAVNPASSGMQVQVWRNAVVQAPTLMSQIGNGLGAYNSFSYSTLSNPAVYTWGAAVSFPQINLTAPIPVVSSVTSPDGVGGTFTTNYSYAGLRAELYTGRGVLGFERMTTSQTQAGVSVQTTSTYSQNWPTTGLPLTISKTYSAAAGPNHQTSLVTHTYGCLNILAGSGNCVVAPGRTYFPYVAQTLEQHWDLDGTAFPALMTINSYDSYGNLLQATTSTLDGYTKTVLNTYSNDTTNWFLGRLNQSRVTHTSPEGAQTRTSSFGYNSSNGLLAYEMVEPNDPQLCQLTSYSYDGYGNKTATSTGNCPGAAGTAVFAKRGSTVSTAPTSTNPVAGQFVTSSANALNQSESRQYDNRFGGLTWLTGPNGLTSQWTYDTLGRLAIETRADGNQTQYLYQYCQGVNGGNTACPTVGGSRAAYVVVAIPIFVSGATPNGATSRTYYDMLDRPIRQETQGFDGTGSPQAIYQDTQYNNLGQVSAVSRPYYAGQTVYWTQSTYDVLGRVVATVQADNSTTRATFSGLNSTLTNANNQATTTVKNSQGRVISVTDANNQATTYAHDPLGNLVRSTDVAGNVISFTYDIRGRKTRMVDPDMGTWSYAYDALGQLVSQTNAKGNVTTMGYDLLGRMTVRTEPDLISNWYYDSDKTGTACPYAIGKLCQATTSTGYNRQIAYDRMGRTSRVSTTLDTGYTQLVTYDINGRIDTQTYPGGVQVRYGYTDLSYLKNITRTSTNQVLWQASAMDAEGHLLQQAYGNGLQLVQAFNAANGRVSSITAGAGNSVFNNTYQYDSLGNVTSRSDGVSSLTESFTYDALNRMTSSSVNASATLYSTQYGYANTGNITAKSDLGQYSYNTVSIPASPNYTCPSYATLAGSNCVYTQTSVATPNYSCSSGKTLSGTNCVGASTSAAAVTYTCPGGGQLSGSSCVKSTVTAATQNTNCPGSFKITGAGACSYTAGTSTLVEAYCRNAVAQGYAITNLATGFWGGVCGVAGKVIYACPAGTTLSGASCMASSTTAATPLYSCPSGTLSGSSCVVTATSPANVNFSCAVGQTLAGTSCVYTNSTPATANYSCPSGQALTGNSCLPVGAVVASTPHTLRLVGNSSDARYNAYDANGNRVSENWTQGANTTSSRAYSYTSFNMPATLSSTTGNTVVTEAYLYGPEHQRVKQSSSSQGTIYYLNPDSNGALLFEKQIKPDNSQELRSFITAGGRVVAVVKQLSSPSGASSEQTQYHLRDAQDSTNVVTDDSGNVLERLGYEPFGKRRQATGPQDPNNTLAGVTTTRGYTNHEHLDELGLIHMNGRVYDPMTARFLTADPFIQAPLNSQSYNRYSYVWNSPLNAVDPSGYWGLGDLNPVRIASHAINQLGSSVGKAWHDPLIHTVAVIAIAYYTGEYVGAPVSDGGLGAGNAVGAAAGGFAGGFVGGGGNFSDGLKGAVTASLFYQVGSAYSFEQNAAMNVAGHAAVGCLSATMAGGDCGSGALAAGIAAYASNNMPPSIAGPGNLAYQTAYVSMVGGVTSVIGGGKFENGAVTAGFGYLFNTMAQSEGAKSTGDLKTDENNTNTFGSSGVQSTINSSWNSDELSAPKTSESSTLVVQVSDITGFTRHGLNQTINRAVPPAAMLDAVSNPIRVEIQSGGTIKYTGSGAVVILNGSGQVVTTWRK